jgi:UTP:GlnB (protein PII) uridylyltransferase
LGGRRLQVHIATKRGVLLDALQLFADLDLSVNKAYISCDGWWFMYVFHVTDRFGRKLTDGVIDYIQQVGDARFLPTRDRTRKWASIPYPIS